MALSFTYAQECCFCLKRFKTLRAVEKHTETKHPEKTFNRKSIRFWNNEEQLVSVPGFKCMDRRSKDYKEGYLPWLAGLTEQMNGSLHPCLRGRWFTIVFSQVPERFFAHFVAQIGCNVHSMRQYPHKKPPFYSASTKRISYKVFSIASFADALHEQDTVKLKESILYSGQEEIANGDPRNDPTEELRAAKNRTFWKTTQGTPDKRINYKGTLEVSEGDGRATREVELIWLPGLFSATNHGKLTVRFFVKKVSL